MSNTWRAVLFGLVQALVLTCGIAWAQDTTEEEGGIIGTGILGILQTDTLWKINGLTIDVAPDAQVRSPLGLKTPDDVTDGAVLALSVAAIGDRWAATDIRQIYPLVGPVEQVLETGIVVMGTVATLTAVPLADWPEVGAWIAVSGVWKGNAIAASAVQVLPEQTQAMITGTLVRDAAGVPMIGDTLILDVDPADFASGDVVEILGTLTTRGLLAQTVLPGPFTNRPDIVMSQGFLSQPDDTGFYTLLGSGSTAIAADPHMINPDAQVMRCDFNGILAGTNGTVHGAQVAVLAAQLGCDFAQ